jgi:predicted Co/Zn/Cd cation transporter (cation efflux family)
MKDFRNWLVPTVLSQVLLIVLFVAWWLLRTPVW